MTQKLRLTQSIPLGIGSILGSGVLFLPSLTYKVALNDVLISWLLIIALCIPGILFFSEMLEGVDKDNSSMSDLVSLGLGKHIAHSTHVILLGTVIFGMPSAAIIAGNYMAKAFSVDSFTVLVPFLILLISFVVCYRGVKASSRVASVITIILLIIATYLIVTTFRPLESYQAIKPSFNLGNIYEGAVLAFWAFAGFENLTFLYDKFEKPRRDLILTIAISVIFCGLIYIFLVCNYAALVPVGNIDDTVGLLQLTGNGEGHLSLIYVIGGFALFSVIINFLSWTSGIESLIVKSVRKGILKKELVYIFATEKSPLIVLFCVFAFNTGVGLASPDAFNNILKTVSSNFLILYTMLVASYVLYTKSKIKKIVSGALLILLLVTISSSGSLLVYPLILFLFSVLSSLRNEFSEVADE